MSEIDIINNTGERWLDWGGFSNPADEKSVSKKEIGSSGAKGPAGLYYTGDLHYQQMYSKIFGSKGEIKYLLTAGEGTGKQVGIAIPISVKFNIKNTVKISGGPEWVLKSLSDGERSKTKNQFGGNLGVNFTSKYISAGIAWNHVGSP